MVEIIQFTEKYASQVPPLVIDVFENEFGYTGIDRPDLFNIRKVYQKDDFSNFWVAVDKGKVVGTIAIANYANGRGYLKRFVLNKKYRGTGLAQKMFDTLLKFAKSKNYIRIYLGTEPEMVASMKFYEKNGFKQIKELPKDIPPFVDTVFYELKIDYSKDDPDDFDDKYTMAKRMVF